MTSSTHLQREANAARVGLADTLGQLREGMAPAALSGEALAIMKDTGLSLVKSLAEQARANPVPALLIGAGLTMLLTRTTGGDVMSAAGSALKGAAATSADAARGAAGAAASTVKDAARRATDATKETAASTADAAVAAGAMAGDAVGERVDSLRQQATEGLQKAGEGIGDRYAAARDKVQDTVDEGRRAFNDGRDRVSEYAAQAKESARTMADDTRDSVAKLLEEQPILMAALGAALGAAVGAALPLSKQEKDMLAGLGATALGAGRKVASKAADVVREEVATADLGSKVGEVADKVVTGVMGAAGTSTGEQKV